MFGIKKRWDMQGTSRSLATGLPDRLARGKRTKIPGTVVGLEKEYDAEMTLGGRTESFDAATPVIEAKSTEGIDESRVLPFSGSSQARGFRFRRWAAVSGEGVKDCTSRTGGVWRCSVPPVRLWFSLSCRCLSACRLSDSASHARKGRTSGAS